jgi:hypothetical protein
VLYNPGSSAYAFNNGVLAGSIMLSTTSSPFNAAHYVYQGYARVKIEKDGNIITISTTETMGDLTGSSSTATVDVGGSNPYNAPIFTFDLTDKATWLDAPVYVVGDELEKFVTNSKIGYLTASQSNTQFFDIAFSGSQVDFVVTEESVTGDTITFDVLGPTSINCVSTVELCEDYFTVCGDIGIDLNDILSTDISTISSLKEFKDTISTELIDTTTFKTSSAYPTLRLLYDRYMNSTKYCDTLSSQFDYCDMIQFSELVGTYWVDLIEQVVPSTTIWGSTYVYGNTLWDQQKFQYKKYSLFVCNLPNFGGDVLSPTTGWTEDVQVEWETLANDEYYNEVSGSTTGETFSEVRYRRVRSGTKEELVKDNDCMGAGIVQMNCGSEFIGKITDYRTPVGHNGGNGGDIVVTECSIAVEIYRDGEYLEAMVSGDVTGPVTYLWSNGETTSSVNGIPEQTSLSVTVTDNGIEGCYASTNSKSLYE